MQFALHTTSPRAIERAAEAFRDRQQAAHEALLSGFESYDELTFQELLDLQDEASEDDSLDTFNDVSRELRDRRQDARIALVKLFVSQAKVGGEVPMTEGGKVVAWPMARYLTESMGNAWASMMADALLTRDCDRLFAAMAQEFANEQAEELLRAGWAQ